jgi:dihydroorotate dehydrogenase electron transfer subunit
MASKPLSKKHALTARIRDIQLLENGWFNLSLHAPEIADKATPGQFVQVQVSTGTDPLLRRPFSIAGATPTGDIELLIRAVGQGTRILSQKKPGDALEIIGPLGRGFPHITGRIWTVAGGTGLAPFLFLAKTLNKTQSVTPFYGACTATDCRFLELPPYQFIMDQAPPVITTEDGGMGMRGLVTHALENRLQQCTDQEKPDAIFSCGPLPMMKKVYDLAAVGGIPCYVSLEAFMGCGFGACMGCVIPAVAQPYFHVCEQGPVFPAGDIAWDKLGNPEKNHG